MQHSSPDRCYLVALRLPRSFLPLFIVEGNRQDGYEGDPYQTADYGYGDDGASGCRRKKMKTELNWRSTMTRCDIKVAVKSEEQG